MIVAERDDDELIHVPPRSKGLATGVVLKQRKRPKWMFASSLFAEYRTVRCFAQWIIASCKLIAVPRILLLF
jgi:hypothetical protein